jgi:hypothetical protein
MILGVRFVVDTILLLIKLIEEELGLYIYIINYGYIYLA